MTSSEREAQIREEIQYLFDNRTYYPVGDRQVVLYVDKFGGLWFNLVRRNKLIAIVTSNYRTIHVRKDTVYLDMFKAYAELIDFRLIKLPEIVRPRGPLGNAGNSHVQIFMPRQEGATPTGFPSGVHTSSELNRITTMTVEPLQARNYSRDTAVLRDLPDLSELPF